MSSQGTRLSGPWDRSYCCNCGAFHTGTALQKGTCINCKRNGAERLGCEDCTVTLVGSNEKHKIADVDGVPRSTCCICRTLHLGYTLQNRGCWECRQDEFQLDHQQCGNCTVSSTADASDNKPLSAANIESSKCCGCQHAWYPESLTLGRGKRADGQTVDMCEVPTCDHQLCNNCSVRVQNKHGLFETMTRTTARKKGLIT
jgi:hypothetical protein